MLSSISNLSNPEIEKEEAFKIYKSLQAQKTKADIIHSKRVELYEQTNDPLQEEQALTNLIKVKKHLIKLKQKINDLQIQYEFPELDVGAYEWRQAKAFFEINPHLTKLPKLKTQHKDGSVASPLPEKYLPFQKGLKHSFILVNGIIYAKKPGLCRGDGGQGKIKTIQNEQNETYVVKIEPSHLKAIDNDEIKAMTRLSTYHGQAVREYEHEALTHTFTEIEIESDSQDDYEVEVEYEQLADFGKEYKNVWTEHKLYTVQDEAEGDDLFEQLYWAMKGNTKIRKEDLDSLTLTQKLIIAIKSTEALQKLHDLHIIHGDIKPENMMIFIQGHHCTVKLIDFNFAKISDDDQPIVLMGADGVMGSINYTAPEIPTDDYINLEVEFEILENQVDDKRLYETKVAAIEEKMSKLVSCYSYASDIFALGTIFMDDLMLSQSVFQTMLNAAPDKRPSCETILEQLYQALQLRDDLTVDAIDMLAKYKSLHCSSHHPLQTIKNTSHNEDSPLLLHMYSSPPPPAITPLADLRARQPEEDHQVGCLASMFACLNFTHGFFRYSP